MIDPDTPTLNVSITMGCGCQHTSRHVFEEDDETPGGAEDLLFALQNALNEESCQDVISNGGACHEDGGDDRMTIILTRGVFGSGR